MPKNPPPRWKYGRNSLVVQTKTSGVRRSHIIHVDVMVRWGTSESRNVGAAYAVDVLRPGRLRSDDHIDVARKCDGEGAHRLEASRITSSTASGLLLKPATTALAAGSTLPSSHGISRFMTTTVGYLFLDLMQLRHVHSGGSVDLQVEVRLLAAVRLIGSADKE
jgi:hypothetical protein